MLKVNIKKKLNKFNLEVNFETDKDIIGLIGSSGSGKSMTLKCIAGIEKPDSGYIIVELDATGADRMLWPVSFAAIDSAGNISDIQYTGKEKATQESSVPTESSAESERSDESSGETSQVSEKSEEESVIEFSAESGGKEEKSESSSKSAGTAAGNTNTGSSTSATVKSDAPSTGETVAAVALLSVLTAALGMIFLSVKKSAE